MDQELDPSLDPGLLQAVLADPVLLQAVDPKVLQAVLVTAAAANLVNTESESQVKIGKKRGRKYLLLQLQLVVVVVGFYGKKEICILVRIITLVITNKCSITRY